MPDKEDLMPEFENFQIEVSDLPTTDSIEFEGLNRNYLTIMIINGGIFFVILLLASTYAWYIERSGELRFYYQWALLALLLLFLATLFLTFKSFQYKRFGFRQKDISYKTGWLWRSIVTIPYNRVQHCEVSQGILDRYFGLAKIKIFTAGGSSSDVSIPGLEVSLANDLKHFILEKVKLDE